MVGVVGHFKVLEKKIKKTKYIYIYIYIYKYPTPLLPYHKKSKHNGFKIQKKNIPAPVFVRVAPKKTPITLKVVFSFLLIYKGESTLPLKKCLRKKLLIINIQSLKDM